jgi:hypothetical protein
MIEVRLRNNPKVSGHTASVAQESFTIIESNSGPSISVNYADVTRVKGHNLSTGAKIGIGLTSGSFRLCQSNDRSTVCSQFGDTLG